MQGEHGLQRLHWRQMVEALLKYPVKCTCSYPEFLAIVPAPKVVDFIVDSRGLFCIDSICEGVHLFWIRLSASKPRLLLASSPLCWPSHRISQYTSSFRLLRLLSKHRLRMRADSAAERSSLMPRKAPKLMLNALIIEAQGSQELFL